MYSKEIAIEIKNISKCFHTYSTPENRLKQSIYPRLQKTLGLREQKYHDDFWALKSINLRVHKGETVGIVGKNGSGKSTLLQLICGTLSPTSGEINTFGRIAALLELGSGFNPDFSGKENVYLNAAVLGLTKEEIDAKYAAIAAFADIGDFINQPLKTYSSGMAVRLAFAVAINVNPEILIIDEALSVGDELFQRKCFSKIEEIKSNGATILFVSHSAATVVDLCDRAILIDKGEALLVGPPKKVVATYQKLLYAPPDKYETLRDQIRSGEPLSFAGNTANTSTAESKEQDDISESFDAGLMPLSTIEYSIQGAQISDARIETLDGRKVNNLIQGKEYNYVYKVFFAENAATVRFGMLIKTPTGIELGGGITANTPANAINFIAANSTYSIKFRFTCSLNPGLYYLNAGALGHINGIETYLHRIIDVAMFRVLPIENNLSTMLVNFNPTVETSLEV